MLDTKLIELSELYQSSETTWSLFPALSDLLMWLWQERKRAKEKMSVQLFAGNASIWRAMTTTILAKNLDSTNLLESRFPRTEQKPYSSKRWKRPHPSRVSYVDPFEIFH